MTVIRPSPTDLRNLTNLYVQPTEATEEEQRDYNQTRIRTVR